MAQVDITAGRWRPSYLRSMLDLQIGQSIDIHPESGDTLEALWGRVRRQATRYQLAGRYFHLHKRASYIFVQRVDKGQQGKLAPFLRLDVGQKMLCSDPLDTEINKKNLRRRLLYLWERGHYIWVEHHVDGKLYYRCAGHLRPRGRLWYDELTDDGSDLRGAQVVCCPNELGLTQNEFARIRAAIFASRAAADGALCE